MALVVGADVSVEVCGLLGEELLGEGGQFLVGCGGAFRVAWSGSGGGASNGGLGGDEANAGFAGGRGRWRLSRKWLVPGVRKS